MKFSERVGVDTATTILQIGKMDDRLRNRIWSEICVFIFDKMGTYLSSDTPWTEFAKTIYSDHFGARRDKINFQSSKFQTQVGEVFFTLKWHEVYNFVEFLASNNLSEEVPYSNRRINVLFSGRTFSKAIQTVLIEEKSGYRFLETQLVAITDEGELEEIQSASQLSGEFKNISLHVKKAAEHFSNRENPDYRNSIKESISAVEAASKIIAGNENSTLSGALKVLKDKKTIPPVLSDGFSKLYGWTSSKDGIRHALMDAPQVGEDEAKYMLVSCSAFANYLVHKK